MPFAAYKQLTPILKSHHNFHEQNGSGEEHTSVYIRPNVFTLRCLHIVRLYDPISYFFCKLSKGCEILYYSTVLY